MSAIDPKGHGADIARPIFEASDRSNSDECAKALGNIPCCRAKLRPLQFLPSDARLGLIAVA